MRDMDESCPFEQTARAAQCSSCIEQHGSLSPCVTAWLESRVGGTVARSQIVPISDFVRVGKAGQKAA